MFNISLVVSKKQWLGGGQSSKHVHLQRVAWQSGRHRGVGHVHRHIEQTPGIRSFGHDIRRRQRPGAKAEESSRSSSEIRIRVPLSLQSILVGNPPPLVSFENVCFCGTHCKCSLQNRPNRAPHFCLRLNTLFWRRLIGFHEENQNDVWGPFGGAPKRRTLPCVWWGGSHMGPLIFWAGFLWVAVEIPAKTGSTPHFKKDAHAVDDHENECITGSGGTVRTSL